MLTQNVTQLPNEEIIRYPCRRFDCRFDVKISKINEQAKTPSAAARFTYSLRNFQVNGRFITIAIAGISHKIRIRVIFNQPVSAVVERM